MLFSIFTVVALTTTTLASAIPALESRQTLVCSGTYSNAQCCATNVLDLADLNCANPPTTPTSGQDLIDICSAIGQQAQCCAIPILGQALLCQEVTP